MESTAPSGSSLPAWGSFEVGMTKKPARRPKITIGMFTRNTEPQ